MPPQGSHCPPRLTILLRKHLVVTQIPSIKQSVREDGEDDSSNVGFECHDKIEYLHNMNVDKNLKERV